MSSTQIVAYVEVPRPPFPPFTRESATKKHTRHNSLTFVPCAFRGLAT
jgi:hypothetical protein